VVSDLCTVGGCNTDPMWSAVTLAANLVADAGGGVVSMSWADPESSQETGLDSYFASPSAVFFAASGDGGLGYSAYPAASPNVVAVGGTYFKRDNSGNFEEEVYGGGGGYRSPFEPRPVYQNGVQSVVGTQRGYPDVASDFCCAPIYLNGEWYSVGGTSWATPTFAGIVNAAGSDAKGSVAELTNMYDVYANQSEWESDFYNITKGAGQCIEGFNSCAGIGSARTYAGK
jgi:kumamolisin